MPKNLRVGLAVFVLIAGITATYFIIQNSSDSSLTENHNGEENKTENQAVELIPDNPLDSSNASSSRFSVSNGKTAKANYNLTNSIAESVFNNLNSSDVVSKINNKISPSGGSLPNVNINDVLSKAQADLRLVSTDDIKDNQLKISSDNSASAKRKYLSDITATLTNDLSNFNKNYLQIIVDTYQKLDSSSAEKAADIYGKLARDFMNTNVPSDWQDVHKATIVYYKNSEVVYRAMADYQNDPIKGYAALEIIEQVADEGLAVQQQLAGKVKLLSKQ